MKRKDKIITLLIWSHIILAISPLLSSCTQCHECVHKIQLEKVNSTVTIPQKGIESGVDELTVETFEYRLELYEEEEKFGFILA